LRREIFINTEEYYVIGTLSKLHDGFTMTTVYKFFSQHPVLIYLLGSVFSLFSACRDWKLPRETYFWQGTPRFELGTYFWQAMAILLLVAFCVQAILQGMWISLSVAVVAIVAEIWWMKKWWARQRSPD
jgi:hypothetical protein